MKHYPKVNEVQEFLEIASDFEDPLEIIRESLSNSYDAKATEVAITIRSHESGSDIVIEDDGNGMSHDDLRSFFDLGNSKKTDSIGHKGHGTKIFYKSNKIVVNTANDGTAIHAVMDQPWHKLNNEVLPEYEVRQSKTRSGNQGTRIQISGFRSGEGFDPQSLTYDRIHNYLKWKTISGSTSHYFDDSQREMDIIVNLDEDIDDSIDYLRTTNQLHFPEEQLSPSAGEYPAARMCKHYPPQRIPIEHSEGTSTLEIVGMIGGKEARNELPTFGRHSTQFGVWLAKDHIKVEQLNDVISHDNEFIHFFFVANCQDLELSANRGKVRNKSSSLYKNLRQELSHYMSKVSEDPWFKKEYLTTRKQAYLQRRTQSQEDSIDTRLKNIESSSKFIPSNRTEVLLQFERGQRDSEDPIRIEQYRENQDISAIFSFSGQLLSGYVHVNLVDHFENDLPISPVDVFVCFEYGDIDVLRQYERSGYHGNEINFDLVNDRIVYESKNKNEKIVIDLFITRRSKNQQQKYIPKL